MLLKLIDWYYCNVDIKLWHSLAEDAAAGGELVRFLEEVIAAA